MIKVFAGCFCLTSLYYSFPDHISKGTKYKQVDAIEFSPEIHKSIAIEFYEVEPKTFMVINKSTSVVKCVLRKNKNDSTMFL